MFSLNVLIEAVEPGAIIDGGDFLPCVQFNSFDFGQGNQQGLKGFTLRNVSRVGNPGLALTRTVVPPPMAVPPSPLPPLRGCQRHSSAAAAYARLFLLEILDRQSDITGVSLAVDVREIGLTWLPFADRGSLLECLVTEKTYPAGLVDDIVGMRAG